jgi:predicted acylesterase/phospholipase RssA
MFHDRLRGSWVGGTADVLESAGKIQRNLKGYKRKATPAQIIGQQPVRDPSLHRVPQRQEGAAQAAAEAEREAGAKKAETK